MKFNRTGVSAAFVRAIPEDIDTTRKVEFVISDATRDRHNTVLNQDGWHLDNYLKNPIVGYNHNVYGGGFFAQASPDNIIGSSSVRLEDKKLIGSVVFEPAHVNPLAEKIFQKVKIGTLRAASVGFSEVGEGRFGEGAEARGAENETYYFAGQELLEWSIVNIPSNPSATKRGDYKAPTIEDILNEYNRLSKDFSAEELARVDIVQLLKAMEGMESLNLTPRVKEKVLLKAAEARLKILKHL